MPFNDLATISLVSLSDNVVNTVINTPLEEIFENTLYNKDTFETWLTDAYFEDDTILLNSAETGAGIDGGTGTAGIEIERGSLDNAKLIFDDNDDLWHLLIGASYADLHVKSIIATDGIEADTVDGVNVFVQSTEPVGLADGDIFIQTV